MNSEFKTLRPVKHTHPLCCEAEMTREDELIMMNSSTKEKKNRINSVSPGSHLDPLDDKPEESVFTDASQKTQAPKPSIWHFYHLRKPCCLFSADAVRRLLCHS